MKYDSFKDFVDTKFMNQFRNALRIHESRLNAQFGTSLLSRTNDRPPQTNELPRKDNV